MLSTWHASVPRKRIMHFVSFKDISCANISMARNPVPLLFIIRLDLYKSRYILLTDYIGEEREDLKFDLKAFLFSGFLFQQNFLIAIPFNNDNVPIKIQLRSYHSYSLLTILSEYIFQRQRSLIFSNSRNLSRNNDTSSSEEMGNSPADTGS